MSSTKDRIVDAVIHEVADSGLSSLTLKAVAARAGIAIGLLSYHYKSRSELLAAAGGRWRGKLKDAEQACWGAFREGSSREDGLRRAVVMAMELGRANQPEMRMILRHVVVEGSLPAAIAEVSFPLVQSVADQAAVLFGVSPMQARAALHQTAILITRLSLISDEELAAVYGDEAAASADEAWASCCALTAETALRALASPGSS